MFERPHHQRIARILESLDGGRLRELNCWFGGGTAIALRYGEYRESVDVDLLASDLAGYRQLRQLLAGRDLSAICRPGHPPLALARELRADQYGIRTMLRVDGAQVKFEIVFEARIVLDVPGRKDTLCGVPTLTRTDMAASKLLANTDRWRDDSVFSRDAIDLAMMDLPPRWLQPAVDKARGAYGPGIVLDMQRAIAALRERQGWLPRCMQSLAITLPTAAIHQRLRALDRRLEDLAGRA